MESFVPGVWQEKIDVNDFVNLNEKGDLFIDGVDLEGVTKSLQSHSKVSFEERLLSKEYIQESIQNFDIDDVKFNFSLSEPKSFGYFFRTGTTTNIRGSLDIGIVDRNLEKGIPPLYFPDIRQIPLYGLDRVIQNKREEIKDLEQMFQTNEWIDEKVEIQRELDELVSLRNNQNIPRGPATDLVEILNSFLELIIVNIGENPKVTFHLPSLLNFINIFLEMNVRRNDLEIVDAAHLIFEFYSKLFLIKEELLAEHNVDFLIVETINLSQPNLVLYLFLNFLLIHKQTNVHLTVFYSHSGFSMFKEKIEKLMKMGGDVNFENIDTLKKKKVPSMSHLKFPYISDTDVILYNKPFDFEKVLYLALNGGKDVWTNRNIQPVYVKFKDDVIPIDKITEEFTHMVSTALTSFSEINNLTMYLADKYFYHPLRSSLKKRDKNFKFIYSFSGIEYVARIFATLDIGNYELVRDGSGFITDISIRQDPDIELVNDYIYRIAIIIQEESERLPLYQSGRAYIHCFVNEIIDELIDADLSLPKIGERFSFKKESSVDNLTEIEQIFSLNIDSC